MSELLHEHHHAAGTEAAVPVDVSAAGGRAGDDDAVGEGAVGGGAVEETVRSGGAGPVVGTFAGKMALAVGGTGLGLVAAHAAAIPTPPCPLRTATGFPCPFCGLTHVARSLVEGHVGLVVRHDPAALVLAVALAVAVVAQLTAMVRRTDGPGFMTSRVLGVVVAAVLAAHWGTTIVTGGMLTA